MKNPTKPIMNKCDALLTPIIKITTPYCESCSSKTEVAHHWIEKSRSANLRYDFRNLVALCHSCHAKIHNRFGNSVVGGLDVAEIIIKKRGRKWKTEMDREGAKVIKFNVPYLQEKLQELKTKLSTL